MTLGDAATSSAATRRPAAALRARLPPGQRAARGRGRSPTRCATRRPPRSAGALLVAGGTDGTPRARRDPQRRPRAPARARHRPPARHPLAHAAGAALGGTFYVLGGRGDGRPASAAHLGHRPRDRARAPRRAACRPRCRTSARPAAGGRCSWPAAATPQRRRPRRACWSSARSRAGAAVPRRSRARRDRDVYAADRARALAGAAGAPRPARVYVPNSQSNTVDVIDQRTAKIVDHFAVGALPQHVTPVVGPAHAVGHQRHRQQPDADRPAHRPPRPPGARCRPLQPVLHRRRAARDRRRRGPPRARLPRARTRCSCVKRCTVPQCAGVDHMDFTADGRLALVSCEFAGRMVVVDLERERVRQDDRPAARARCPRTSSSRPTGARSTSPTWPPTASG